MATYSKQGGADKARYERQFALAMQHGEKQGQRKLRDTLRENAIAWIAANDDSETLDASMVAGYVSTLLVADLLGCNAATLAAEVVAARLALFAPPKSVGGWLTLPQE